MSDKNEDADPFETFDRAMGADECLVDDEGEACVDDARVQMEGAEAKLQQLGYERASHQRGIRQCRADAPEPPPAGLVSAAEVASLAPHLPAAGTEHDQTLQQLAVECSERKRLREVRGGALAQAVDAPPPLARLPQRRAAAAARRGA